MTSEERARQYITRECRVGQCAASVVVKAERASWRCRGSSVVSVTDRASRATRATELVSALWSRCSSTANARLVSRAKSERVEKKKKKLARQKKTLLNEEG